LGDETQFAKKVADQLDARQGAEQRDLNVKLYASVAAFLITGVVGWLATSVLDASEQVRVFEERMRAMDQRITAIDARLTRKADESAKRMTEGFDDLDGRIMRLVDRIYDLHPVKTGGAQMAAKDYILYGPCTPGAECEHDGHCGDGWCDWGECTCP
jgi:hypothetical protein